MGLRANFDEVELKTWARRHRHPERKFLNGDYDDRRLTRRRYVRAVAFQNIGKEANE
jgi:hypothetical protein